MLIDPPLSKNWMKFGQNLVRTTRLTFLNRKVEIFLSDYLSPQDTAFAVIVEAPKAVLGQRQVSNEYRQPVEGAHVELSDRSWTAWLVYSTRNGLYSLPVRYSGIGRPVPGRTYTLTVSAPGYTDVTAQCTVRLPASSESTQVESPSGVKTTKSLPTWHPRL